MVIDRRKFLTAGMGGFLCAALGVSRASEERSSPIIERARALLEMYQERISNRETMAIVDFALHSSVPRLHLIDVVNGAVASYLVAHGRGSDPNHTGWLARFSNEPHSRATSAGAYLTSAEYVGAHGRSLRLEGLEPNNDNAAMRGIVVHGAPYVSDDMIHRFGKLGRSEGCLAVSAENLHEIIVRLRPGSLIVAVRG
jgi:L,D-transpeptidase catalytic domain